MRASGVERKLAIVERPSRGTPPRSAKFSALECVRTLARRAHRQDAHPQILAVLARQLGVVPTSVLATRECPNFTRLSVTPMALVSVVLADGCPPKRRTGPGPTSRRERQPWTDASTQVPLAPRCAHRGTPTRVPRCRRRASRVRAAVPDPRLI